MTPEQRAEQILRNFKQVTQELIQFAEEQVKHAVEAEREACAKLADAFPDRRWFGQDPDSIASDGKEIAALIRARGEPC